MKQCDNSFNVASEEADNDADHLYTIQREIQRKLGRNILLIQQYERLIKAFITNKEISGFIDEWPDIKARRIEKNFQKTLGQTTGEFINDCLVSTLPESHLNKDEEIPFSQNKIWLSINRPVLLEGEEYEEVKEKMGRIVDLRNRLVHHFSEKHDIGTETGCQRADDYLEDCYRQIDELYKLFRMIAKVYIEADKQMAAFFQSPEFQDFLLHGIIPGGGGVLWPSSTIVAQLKKAETVLAKAGWTSLQYAIEYIRQNAPYHMPQRYGCSSWRHVLHESQEFDIRKEQIASGLPTVTFFRSRA
ncbi:MAG: hypothetical protein MESAZ_00340 [Saezia sanguinis]